MKVYIASSWRNEHGVLMLTHLLREEGMEVISWVENNYGESHNHVTKKQFFEQWVHSEESWQSFDFDTKGATSCDLFIYYAPAGKDAFAEMGAAWAKGIPIIGIWAKSEELGLMHKMVLHWAKDIWDLIAMAKEYNTLKNPVSSASN